MFKVDVTNAEDASDLYIRHQFTLVADAIEFVKQM